MSARTPVPSRGERVARALASLRGLAVGDALGSQFFVPGNLPFLRRREVPPGPWQWTDDTEMAASVAAVLAGHGHVDQDALAASFAEHHDFDRGYGPAVNRMLRLIRQEGGDWRELASSLFDGQGSWGNGGAMRVAPLGAWYADNPERAAGEAARSAEVTHRHPEAVAGTRAVAAAAALVGADAVRQLRQHGADATGHGGNPHGAAGPAGGGHADGASAQQLTPETLLTQVLELVPRSAVHAGLRRAIDLLDYADVGTVAAVLGCGRHTSAQDTVPFTLWTAARHLRDFRGACWTAADAGGDVDTTCAIVGGVLAAGGPVSAPPREWDERTEAFPTWLLETLR
ncbi:ADP-ribosylglycohydrolase family protein [Streptomyces albus subsp. chlorinus]|uniref:ADP-ribosylglycohydrolase family protein n=1 Tax=Streptomyces albus TaxID=1888 RepID=UPI00156F7A3F|nr:ADP-ribosylglycohydrolase family protein [Streptomyces albus]NSC24289.1 ADP-ribosylglycohydrolase family protein [Streptomyces albus subsp. chlorinus]